MNDELFSRIDKVINDLFERTKLRILGPNYVSDEHLGTANDFDPSSTVSSIYLNAFSTQSIGTESLDKSTIDKISNVLSGYIDSLKEKTKNQVSAIITNYTHEAETKAKLKDILVEDYFKTMEGRSTVKQMKDAVVGIFRKTDQDLGLLVSNEFVNTQNLGILDGIIGIAKSLEINDPVVFKRGIIGENHPCPVCRKLWHSEENINIPKTYRLSDLKGGYNTDKKNPIPTIAATHPNCSHTLGMLMPNFGFDENGRIVWVGKQS